MEKEVRQKYLPGRLIRRERLTTKKTGSKESGIYVCVDKKCLAPAKSMNQLLNTIEEAKVSGD